MKVLVWNIFLALIWSAATGHFTLQDLAIGYALGFVILWFLRGTFGPTKYFLKFWQAIGFFLFFLVELFQANLRVAYDVVTPPFYMRPGVVAIPLDAKTNLEITLLANLITLTPGTLALDVSDDRRVLYIHAMFIEDPEKLRKEIKDGFERRLLELLR